MNELSARNFGLLIAYVLPGFVALWGVSVVSAPVRVWLVGTGSDGPSAAGVVYVFLLSIGAGMTASVIRWALLDTVLHQSGLRRPAMDFSRLNQHLQAFDRLVEHHYQYYQFYGNTLIAALAAYPTWRAIDLDGRAVSTSADLVFIILELFFAAGARDALRNFYARAGQLLGSASESHHDERIRTSRNLQEARDQEPSGAQAAGEGGDGVRGTAGTLREAGAEVGAMNAATAPLHPYAFGRL